MEMPHSAPCCSFASLFNSYVGLLSALEEQRDMLMVAWGSQVSLSHLRHPTALAARGPLLPVNAASCLPIRGAV